MGDEGAGAIDDRRMALAAEGDGFLHLAYVSQIKGADGDPAGPEAMGQKDGRLALGVGHYVAEGNVGVIESGAQPVEQLRRQPVTDFFTEVQPEGHAAFIVDDGKLAETKAAGQLVGSRRRPVRARRLGEKGKRRFGIQGITVERRRDVLGQQEVLFRYGGQFLLHRRLLDPGAEDQQRYGGDEYKGRSQKVAKARFQPRILPRKVL